jgi:hypothetical protein
VVHNESLKTSALISSKSDPIKQQVNDLVTKLIVAPGKHIGRVFLAADQVLWVEEFLVSAVSNLIDASRLQVDLYGTGDVFASLN